MQKTNLLEDYLECILKLQRTNGFARSIDIARELGVTKPTVCEMVKRLSEKEYLYLGDNKCLFLTDYGKEVAQKIHEKHIFIETFLLSIGVSKENANGEAGMIGNFISEETYNCLGKLYKSSNFTAYRQQ
ncbi:MAG: metal-dependent transcriptional regulator [Lachnospiraceae bacterium]|nr:metal-dependent transcriptional regulator [Lachnospiraceae bacterium]